MTRLGKCLAYVLLAVVILVLLAALLAFVVLGTDAGFSRAAKTISDRVDGLELNEVSGSLSDTLQIGSATWEQNTVSVDAEDVTLDVSSRCFVSRKLCVNDLSIDRVEIITRAPDHPPPPKERTSIELPTIELPIDAEISNITLNELVLISETADGEMSEPLVVKDITLAATSSGSNIKLDTLSLAHKQFSLDAHGVIETTGDYPLDLTINATAKDIIEDNSIQARAELKNSLKRLFINTTLSDAIDVKIAGIIEPLEPDLPAELGIEWQALGWPLDNPVTALSEQTRIDVSGTLDDYGITLKTRVSGEQVPDTTINLAGKVNPERALIHDVTLYTLDGFVTGSAAADWSRDVAWVSQLVTRDINPGVKYDDMAGSLNGLFRLEGFVVDGQWSAALTQGELNGTLRNFPFSLDLQASRSLDAKIQVQQLTLENGPNTVNINGTYTELVDASVELNLPALHYLLPDIAGNVSGTARILGKVTEPDVTVDLSSGVLRFQDILAKDVSIIGDINTALFDSSNVSATVALLQQGQNRANNVALDLTGTRDDHTITLALDGPERTSADVTLQGGLSENFDWAGALVNTTLGLPQHQVTLVDRAPLRFSKDSNAVSIDAHCWATGEARLCLTEPMTASASGQANLTFDNYALSRLNPIISDAVTAGDPAASKPRIGGTLTSTARVAWGGQSDAFDIRTQSQIRDGSVAQTDINGTTHQFRYSSLDVNADVTPSQLTSSVVLTSENLGSGRANVTMNTADVGKPINGTIDLTGFDLGFLSALIPDIDESGGTVNIEGALNGSLASPLFDGRIELQQPVLSGETLPVSLEGGQIITDIAGTAARITGELTTDGGNVDLTGDVTWPETTGLSADVRIASDGLSLAQPPVTQASVMPDIRIRYQQQSLAVSGTVKVPSADIDIKDLPEGTSSLSDDVVVIEDIEADAGVSAEETTPLNLDVAVDVSLGDDVDLSGYGLIAKLAGDIKVTKTNADPPQLFGELLVTEGLYKSYGQNLSVQNGQILFVGPVDQTRLDIQAVRYIENEDRVAGLQLDGPLADPVVTLFTEPADKSQESILSYIVLGRDLGDNSSEDSNLLANAALALTLKEGRGFATGFAESLGISDFSIEASGSGDDTQVVLSGRLSDRLLLRYGRGVFAADESLFLRYDITKSLYLEAAQGVERAVDLFYSFSF